MIPQSQRCCVLLVGLNCVLRLNERVPSISAYLPAVRRVDVGRFWQLVGGVKRGEEFVFVLVIYFLTPKRDLSF